MFLQYDMMAIFDLVSIKKNWGQILQIIFSLHWLTIAETNIVIGIMRPNFTKQYPIMPAECGVLPNLQSEPHWPPFWPPCGSVFRYPEPTERTRRCSKKLSDGRGRFLHDEGAPWRVSYRGRTAGSSAEPGRTTAALVSSIPCKSAPPSPASSPCNDSLRWSDGGGKQNWEDPCSNSGDRVRK